MAAMQKKVEVDVEVETAEQVSAVPVVEVIPTTISRQSPFRSPARDLQQTLARRLQDPPTQSPSEVAYGLIAGIIGATWVTGILIYASL